MSLNQNTLLQAVTRYWDKRAASYSQSNQAELHSDKRAKWQRCLLAHAPQGKKLKVLDIGTGPGFFAIVMAQAGHEVCAIDATDNMLAQARNNAERAGVSIEFHQGDVQRLPFADESFDLVVSRNVTWNLKLPEQAYAEWYRVLKCGGRLLNFDANWYLHLFDDGYRQGYLADRAATARLGLDDHYVNTDTVAMENIARELPLSRRLRPHWDMQTLLNIGFSKFILDSRIGDQLWDETEKINYASTPMFMIAAEK
ncbi:class I SAM-dependent methyltransferase [Pasteurellaceae bacterium LIM206]|nr:class I SAM-dependent methyltransferase [Pasteurellaceae bacterium LIM206]